MHALAKKVAVGEGLRRPSWAKAILPPVPAKASVAAAKLSAEPQGTVPEAIPEPIGPRTGPNDAHRWRLPAGLSEAELLFGYGAPGAPRPEVRP